MSIIDSFNEKFKVDDYKIYDTQHWTWSLRPHQATLGSGILSLKRECASLSEVTEAEFADLKKIVLIIEGSLSNRFDYDVINYLMLMMFDKQVHYHVLPRYENDREFNNQKWNDEQWPAIPPLMGEAVSDEKANELIQAIKETIKEIY